MTNTTCAACGTSQAPGAAWCAACGTAFPRQGTPAAQSGVAPRPVTSAAASAVPVHTGTTEPERIGATVRGYSPPAPAPAAAPEYAHAGRRFAAWAIDSVALAIIPLIVLLVGLSLVGIPLDGGVVMVTPQEAQELLTKAAVTYLVAGVSAVVAWIVVVAVEGRTGRTVAGLLLGLRTVDADSSRPIGFWRSALRWFLIGVSSFGLGVGQFVMVLSPAFDSGTRRQGWHDKAARSVVLRSSGRAAKALGPVPAGTVFAHGHAQVRVSAQGSAHGPAQGLTPGPAPAGWGAAPTAPASAASNAPALPDPWAFPSSAPATKAPPSGLITGIPGGGMSSAAGTPPAPAAPSVPAPSVPAFRAPALGVPAAPAPALVASAAGSVSAASASAASGDDIDGETRMTPARPRVLVLELATGERQAITGRTLLGRNPQAPAGEPWDVVTVPDPTRSVSKTHAEMHPDQGGLWIVDRGSTNGTVVSVPGRAPQVAAPGSRVRVTAGATVHLGDARVLIHPDAS